jgi:Gpi18-like mannosyltransferase
MVSILEARPLAAHTRDRPWRHAAVAALVVWAASHLAYLIINLLHRRAMAKPAPGLGTLIGDWQKWDAGHYLRIAEFGYQDQFELDRAFFPFYPLLIKAADVVLPQGLLTAALVVSNLAAYGALLMLHRLTTHELGTTTADRTIYYLVAFPPAFFLVAPYNHSLFLLFATSSLYAMRTGRWWLAGSLAALASGTRSVGVLLTLPFAYEYLRQRSFQPRRVRLDALALLLVPGGLVTYAVYCQVAFGNLTAFSQAQRFWHRSLDWPWNSLWRTIREPFKWGFLEEFWIINLIDFAAAIMFLVLLALCVVGPWKLRSDQIYLFLFGVAVVMAPLVYPASDNRPLISMARHVIDVIPAFMLLGRIGENRVFNRLYPMPAIAFQTMLLMVFMNYDWAG